MVDPTQMSAPGGPSGAGMPGMSGPPGGGPDPTDLLKRMFRSKSKHKRGKGKKRK